MTDTNSSEATDDIEEWIRQNQPVEQDRLEYVFGSRGISQLRDLMEAGKVSYTIDWKLQSETKQE